MVTEVSASELDFECQFTCKIYIPFFKKKNPYSLTGVHASQMVSYGSVKKAESLIHQPICS